MTHKIAFVLTQSLDSPSGLGRFFPLAKELAKKGHNVDIIALHHHWESLGEKKWQQESVNIHYVAQMHVKKIDNNKIYFSPLRLFWIVIWATVKLTWTLFKVNPDLVLVGKPHPMNGIAAWLFKTIKHKPMYVDCDDYEAGSNKFSGTWQRKIIAWFENYLPLQADFVTVNTYFGRDRLIRLGYSSQKISYLPNGVDHHRFPPNIDYQKVKQLLKQYNLQNKKVILYVGSLSLASHSVDLLIEAFAGVTEDVANTILMLVGGGEDTRKLVDLARSLGINNKVIFVGRVDPQQVVYYYHLAYVSVDPVINDDAAKGRSPLKIFESLALGVPVVTGDVGERRSELQASEFGLLVKPGCVQALTTGLLTILQKPDLRAKMAQRALTERSRWYWENRVDAFVKLLGTN